MDKNFLKRSLTTYKLKEMNTPKTILKHCIEKLKESMYQAIAREYYTIAEHMRKEIKLLQYKL